MPHTPLTEDDEIQQILAGLDDLADDSPAAPPQPPSRPSFRQQLRHTPAALHATSPTPKPPRIETDPVAREQQILLDAASGEEVLRRAVRGAKVPAAQIQAARTFVVRGDRLTAALEARLRQMRHDFLDTLNGTRWEDLPPAQLRQWCADVDASIAAALRAFPESWRPRVLATVQQVVDEQVEAMPWRAPLRQLRHVEG